MVSIKRVAAHFHHFLLTLPAIVSKYIYIYINP